MPRIADNEVSIKLRLHQRLIAQWFAYMWKGSHNYGLI